MTAKVIGIGGYARCGKDTFVGIAKNILTKAGYNPVRVAFADKLKEEVSQMLQTNGFSATVYTEDSAVKAFIRPLLVWWGCQRRRESEGGLYWVNMADQKIRCDMKVDPMFGLDPDKTVFLVSDVRFPNEASWIHETWDGELIHLKRYTTHTSESPVVVDGVSRNDMLHKCYDPAPNDEELVQDPHVVDAADQRIEWESKKIMTTAEAIECPYLQRVVLDALNSSKYFKNSPSGKLSL